MNKSKENGKAKGRPQSNEIVCSLDTNRKFVDAKPSPQILTDEDDKLIFEKENGNN